LLARWGETIADIMETVVANVEDDVIAIAMGPTVTVRKTTS